MSNINSKGWAYRISEKTPKNEIRKRNQPEKKPSTARSSGLCAIQWSCARASDRTSVERTRRDEHTRRPP